MRMGMFARWVMTLCAIAAVALSANAQGSKSKTKTTKAAATQAAEPPLRGNNTKEGASQATKSTNVLNEIMGAPDKGIPSDLLAKADCVAVFPNVVKAGFIIGGHGGRGVASCRTSSGWSAPAYFEIKGGSLALKEPHSWLLMAPAFRPGRRQSLDARDRSGIDHVSFRRGAADDGLWAIGEAPGDEQSALTSLSNDQNIG